MNIKYQILLFVSALIFLFSCDNGDINNLKNENTFLTKENDSLKTELLKFIDSRPRELGELKGRLLIDSVHESFYKKSIEKIEFIRLYLIREYSDLLIQGSFNGEKAELFYVISNYSEYGYNEIDPSEYVYEKKNIQISTEEWKELYRQFEEFEHKDLSSDPGKYLGNPISCTYIMNVYSHEKSKVGMHWRILKSEITPSNKDRLPNTNFYKVVFALIELCDLDEVNKDTLFDFTR